MQGQDWLLLLVVVAGGVSTFPVSHTQGRSCALCTQYKGSGLSGVQQAPDPPLPPSLPAS
jgi:hypothetical protein